METIATALDPIPAIVWGELAMGFLGVGTVYNSYMLVIEDTDFDAAVEALRFAGFRDAPWSYGSMKDPRLFQDKKMQGLHWRIALQYRNLGDNSIRFEFPLGSRVEERVVLLRSSYAHLSLVSIPESRFTRNEGVYYPDKELLLESLVKTIVREPEESKWTSNLQMWIVSYVYGQLMVDDNALDSSSDENAKTWFNEHIRRYSGGIDRTTITKRLGRRYNVQQ
ncbi:hypothetical protein F4779DRAFT_610373 [Xylariaceae sp. FL0662B]|nr:hypothetical protein F4779DRAFT_610373 [Xylariaceae sp. FL0662B]